ncbi:MAG: Hsp70 family protein [Clostridia bacterium]|nr:Hsp70 family protein [Clostridia bacterium]
MSSIGIDFGTTNSLMVAYDKQKNKFSYFSYNGDKPTPISSTVWYHDNKITVGSEARENIHRFSETEGHHFEKSIKLRLGSEYTANVFGVKTTPSAVASEIIKHIKRVAEIEYKADKIVDDLRQAVFTVPISFNGKARRDLRKAANEAGIEISTFIHEPFAAIVGYFFTKENRSYDSIISDLQNLDGKYVLTFDWGGGTLDITVVKIENGKMEEYGTSELTNLAGDKFDEYIANWAWNKFLDKIEQGKYTAEYLETCRKKKWGKLLAIAEMCKIELSMEESTEFLLDSVLPDEEQGICETLTRNEFSSLIGNIIDKACNKIDDAIHQAGINDINISHVLLTGGTCCIPVIQNKLREKFGHRVEAIDNGDLVIAQGAAVVSELRWLPFLTKDIQVELSDNSYFSLFEHNMPIATNIEAVKSESFTCVDQRGKIAKVIISDGLEQNKDNTLAILNVPVLADPRFGDEIVVEARLDKDIILHISANSKMVMGYGNDEKYSIRKSAEIYKMCFGLEIVR